MNQGIEIIDKKSWVFFLGSDDWFLDKFTLEKMAVKLDEITKPILDSISSQVKLNLPKLKKDNNSSTSTPSIKLPKLKNLSEKASV